MLAPRRYDIPLVLRALLRGGKVRPLQMQAGQIRPVVLGRLRLREQAEQLEQFLVRAGQRGRQQRRRPVGGVQPRRAEKGLPRAVHKIISAAAVDVDVDKSGGNVAVAVVGHYAAAVRALRADVGDDAVLEADLAVLDDPQRGDDIPLQLVLVAHRDAFSFVSEWRRTAAAYAFSSRTTACAAMPSPRPVKPSFSSVVALTLTAAASMPRTRAIASRIAGI